MLLCPFEDPQATPAPGLRWEANERYAIGWRGALYLPGEASGAATIARLLAAGDAAALERLIDELQGVYCLFVLIREQNVWRIFNDRTALARIYYSDNRVATRFLDLVRAEGKGTSDADSQRVLEFIMQSGNFGPETPVTGLRRLRRLQSLRVDYSRQPAVTVVERPDPPDRPFDPDDVLGYFDELKQAIDGRHVSLDLTGGFDSRVIACLLSQRQLQFDCGLTGIPGSSEQAAATRVAAALGRQLTYHVHDIETLEDDLPRLFHDGDGLTEFPRLHRDWQFCLKRLGRGVEVMVHGGGGEFFRDNFYIQDFPRYGVPNANIDRFYRLRIIPITIPDEQLTPAGLDLRQTILKETRARLETCRAATNNETYERIYRDFRAPELFGTSFSNYLHLGMQVAAPFLEHRMIRVGMRIPPWERFFTRWHRRVITAHCPALAALPTNEGYTASSQPSRLVAELGTYARVQAGRIGRKLTERYLGKSLFHKVGELEADPPGYRDRLRHSTMFAQAVDRLKQQGILQPDLSVESPRNIHVGRMITMGTLLRFLDGEEIDGRT